eukprot:4561421-Karenia_brevis.AAC.1
MCIRDSISSGSNSDAAVAVYGSGRLRPVTSGCLIGRRPDTYVSCDSLYPFGIKQCKMPQLEKLSL